MSRSKKSGEERKADKLVEKKSVGGKIREGRKKKAKRLKEIMGKY